MASTNLFTILAIVVIVTFPTISMAAEHIVGDDSGWTIQFDYKIWAQGMEFVVGDKLVFQYPLGVHNVIKVNATSFQDCVAPADSEVLKSGHDIITLATPGKKWYICGVGQHCKLGGQKLAINVLAASGAPAPSPVVSARTPSVAPNSANGIAGYGYLVFFATETGNVLALEARFDYNSKQQHR